MVHGLFASAVASTCASDLFSAFAAPLAAGRIPHCLRPDSNWLAEAAFSTDTPVTVSVDLGRLVIEPVKG